MKEKDLGDYIVPNESLEMQCDGNAASIEEGDVEELDEVELEASASECECRSFELDAAANGERLDKVLSRLMPEVSRARVQKWIEAGDVSVNGTATDNVRLKVAAFDVIDVVVRPAPQDVAYRPEEGIDFDVVYEDDAILVCNKPAGLVVHPAAGHWQGTMLNGLLYRYPELSRVPRAGIVHRLDKETTGLMVVARTEAAQTDLVRQLQARTVGREYWAVVVGLAPEAGFVDRSIGRDPRSPIRFCCRGGQGSRPAKTHCRLVDVAQVAGRTLSWVACRLETGRTHQIRVHMTSAGLPLLGDPLYRTNASKLPPQAGLAYTFNRQALHASRLALTHPVTGEPMEWFVEPPQDMYELMEDLGFGPLDEPVHVFDEE